MNHNEETLFLLEELGKYGVSQYDAERELSYSPNYLGQLLSRKNSNERVVSALKMVLRIKELESKLGIEQEPAKVVHTKEDDLKEVVNILKEIHASLNDTKHTELLNHCLLKTNIRQSAKIEASITKKSEDAIIEGLNKAVEETFDDIHLTNIPRNQKNKRYPVDA